MLAKLINQYRLFSRSWLMSIMSIPYGLSLQKIRLQLLSWSLCGRATRYQLGNIFFKERNLLDTCCYGETPWIALHRLAKKVKLTTDTRLLDMGSGVGLAACWLSIHTGCRVLGVERNPALIKLGNRLVNGCRLADRISFLEADMFTLPVQAVDVIYIYHSALDDLSILRLGKQLAHYPPEVKIITITYSFVEILPDYFELESCFDGWFPWGVTGIYIQRPKKNKNLKISH